MSRILFITQWRGNIDVSFVAVPGKQFILYKGLRNVDMISKHVELGCNTQNNAETADLEQSSLSNDIFLGARFHLGLECLKRTHRLLIKHHMHMLRVYVTDVDGDPPRQVSACVWSGSQAVHSRTLL